MPVLDGHRSPRLPTLHPGREGELGRVDLGHLGIAISLLVSVAVLRAPALGGVNVGAVYQGAALTPLLLAGAILVLTTRRISRPPLVSLALFVLTVGFIVASIARQSASGPVYDTKAAVLQSLTWVVLCVVAWLAFFRDQPRERLETLKVAVCFAPAIYVAVKPG